MESTTRQLLDGVRSADRHVQGAAYVTLLEASSSPVDWAEDAWDELLADLVAKDNRLRSIAGQLLCNLAASAPRGRIVRDFDKLVEATRDEKFVTARHILQSLWRVGLAGPEQRRVAVEGLVRRYADCAAEKNATLIRQDIVESLRQLYDRTGDETVRTRALVLVESEPDPKRRRQQESAWK